MRPLRLLRILLAGLPALAACDNAGVDLGLPAEPTNTVGVALYLDRDGSKGLSAQDTVYPGARVALLQRVSRDTVQTAVSTGRGLAYFTGVKAGEYSVAVVPASLGDSVEVARVDTADFVVRVRPDTLGVLVRLGYPELTVRQARAAAPNRRVFVRGVILAGVQAFRDTTSYVADSSGQIRLTNVILRGGLAGNNPGDSVTVLGLTGARAGQPILDRAIVARIGARPAPLPVIVTTAAAGTAGGGGLDAALVQVIGAPIIDSATVAPDFKVTLDDGSGPVVLLLDANINVPRTAFIPGKHVTARGVLVPDGKGAWFLKPRDLGDIAVF